MEIVRTLAHASIGVWLVGCASTSAVQGEPAPPPTEAPPAATSPAAESPKPEPIAVESDQASDKAPAMAQSPDDEEPNPYVAPLERHAGDLTVHAPPKERTDFIGGRLRSHIEGTLSKGRSRVWVGPQVPGFVSLIEGTMELFILDRVGDEFLAFYRDPYGASSCDLGTNANCDYFVRLYDIRGTVLWELPLHELLSAPSYLEIQDIRYADGTLYFNEACQSYSSTVKGKCSFLKAVDPTTGEVRWRTKRLVSNGVFLVHGDYIVAGYGFTNEKDFIYVVSRADGSILQKVPLRKSAENFQLRDDGRLDVTVYPGTVHTYEMIGWDTGKPRLVKAKAGAGKRGRSTVAH